MKKFFNKYTLFHLLFIATMVVKMFGDDVIDRWWGC